MVKEKSDINRIPVNPSKVSDESEIYSMQQTPLENTLKIIGYFVCMFVLSSFTSITLIVLVIL